MSQEQILRKLINSQSIKIKGLEIENKELKNKLAQIHKKSNATTNRRTNRVKTIKADPGKIHKPQNITIPKPKKIKTRARRHNYFKGQFFYIGSMAKYGENTGVGVSISNIINEIFTTGEERAKAIQIIKDAIAMLGQDIVQTTWEDVYLKNAEGYGAYWQEHYKTDQWAGAQFFEILEAGIEAKKHAILIG